jgi:hypothetical protein
MSVARTGSWARGVVAVVALTLVAGLLAACEASPPPLLKGRVTHADDGSHPAGVLVRVYSAATENVMAQTVTDAQGNYQFRGPDLAQGVYRLRFSDAFWWRDATSWAEATNVTLADGRVEVVDVSIVPAVGSLSGLVSTDDAAVPGATVEAISAVSGPAIASTTTDASGGFTFNGLPTGPYQVRVSGAANLAATFHPSSATAVGARSVTVVAGQNTGGIDVVLPAAATLTGIVVAGGAPLAGVTAEATTLSPRETHARAVTGPDGRFTLTGLSPVGYLLTLTDADNSVVAGATSEDPDSGVVYPLPAGGSVDAGEIDFGAGGATGPVIVTTTLPQAFVGMPVMTTLDAVGGAGTNIWWASGLPPGLSLDPVMGAISGTPAEAGTSPIELVVTDERGASSTATLSLEVLAGMPEGCVDDDCTRVDVAAGTVELPADAVTGTTRDPDGVLARMTVGPSAPPIGVGQVLVVPRSEHTPEGVIVRATGIADLGAGVREIAVERAEITDAYESALIKSTEAETVVAGPPAEEDGDGLTERGAPTASAVSCDAASQVQVSPNVEFNVDPNVSMLFGTNVFGFGNIFVGPGGLKVFQVEVDTTLTVGLSGRIGGRVHCNVPAPRAMAIVPAGHAGAFTFRLTPSLTLDASAAITLDTSITLRCSMIYRWADGNQMRSQWCRPSLTRPQATSTGADVTVNGAIDVAATFNEAVGVFGQINAELHAGYHPWQRPRGQVDGGVSASINGCLGCLFGRNLGTVTFWQGELYRHRVFHTWGHEELPTCRSLANSSWEGNYQFGEEPPGTWRAQFNLDGSLQEFRIDLFQNAPEVSDVHLDCQSISFVGTMGLATWSGSFDPTRTYLEGTAQVFNGNVLRWTGHRV